MYIRALATILATLSLFAVGSASAIFVDVTITGEVEFNQINGGALGDANTGDAVEISFTLDSGQFNDSTNFPTRGYIMDPGSFSLNFAGGPSIGLQNPGSPGDTPQFIIRNDDPAVDGFFFGSNVDGFNNGVALDQVGIFDAFRLNFLATYISDPLFSLDIGDALGMYDFTGLSVFNMTIDDGPFNAMGMVFDQMTIAQAQAVPITGTIGLVLIGLVGMIGRYRNRS